MTVPVVDTGEDLPSEVSDDEMSVTFDVEPEIPDVPDVDPLFSSITGKTYKTSRGKKIAESRWTNKHDGSTPAPRTMTSRAMKPRLQSFYETIGAAVGLMSPPDGQVIVDAAPACAEAVTEWADSDPRVRAALERLLTGSAMSKVVMAHAPIAFGIMANHGINPLAGLLNRGASNVSYDG